MSSDSSSSSSSSQVNLNTEHGGQRVEVNAVKTGSQQGGSSKDPGIKTTISQAHLDYSVGAPSSMPEYAGYNLGTPPQWANMFVPNSPYGLYDPYNPYSPYNPYNPYIVYAPRPPCPIHGYRSPTPTASPQPAPTTAASPQPAHTPTAAPQRAARTAGSPRHVATTAATPHSVHNPAASPQASAISVSKACASEGASTAGPAPPPPPLVFDLNGKEIIVQDGFDIEEEYINDRLVSRTVNGVVEPLPKKK